MKIYMNKDTLAHSIHKENIIDKGCPRSKIVSMKVSDEIFLLMKMVNLPRYYEMAEELLEANKLSVRVQTRISELLNFTKEKLAFNS